MSTNHPYCSANQTPKTTNNAPPAPCAKNSGPEGARLEAVHVTPGRTHSKPVQHDLDSAHFSLNTHPPQQGLLKQCVFEAFNLVPVAGQYIVEASTSKLPKYRVSFAEDGDGSCPGRAEKVLAELCSVPEAARTSFAPKMLAVAKRMKVRIGAIC